MRYICTIVDHTSGHLTTFSLRSITAENYAKGFYHHYICIYGVPLKIRSDRGQQFLSKIYTELAKLMHFQIALTASYKPFTNGMTERANRSIVGVLRSFIVEHQNQWSNFLPSVTFALNATPSFEHLSAFNIRFGTDPNFGYNTKTETEMQPMHAIIGTML